MSNRQKKQPPKVVDRKAEFDRFLYRATNGQTIPAQAERFAEAAFLVGASMMAVFVMKHGPKGAKGFVTPSNDDIVGRLKIINEVNALEEQQRAAFANSDGEPNHENASNSPQ